MSDGASSRYQLSEEERLCLRSWFRQAIAILETEEITTEFLRFDGLERGLREKHREPICRRTHRSKHTLHNKEFVCS